MKTCLQIAGVSLMMLGFAHTYFPRYFGWKSELASLPVFTRQVFFVHSFFIALTVMLQGALVFFLADPLLEGSPLSCAILSGLTLFWGARILVQFFVYDPVVWRGNRFRTFAHLLFSIYWIFLAITFSAPLVDGML